MMRTLFGSMASRDLMSRIAEVLSLVDDPVREVVAIPQSSGRAPFKVWRKVYKASLSKRYKPNGGRECARRVNQIRNNAAHPFGTVKFAGATLKIENGLQLSKLSVSAVQDVLNRRYARGEF